MSNIEPELYNNIVKHIDDGIIVVDANMCVYYLNKWIEQRSNKKYNDVFSKNLTEVFPEIQQSRLYNAINDTLKNFTPQFLSNLFHNSPILLYPAISAFGSNEPKPLQLDINIIPIKHHNNTACIIQVRDVSFSSRRENALEMEIFNRSIIEKNLRESESRYRLLAENSSDIIIKTDANFAMNYISPSCIHHLGYKDIELVNKTILNITHADDIEAFNLDIQSNTATSKDISIRHRLLTKNGSYQWFESTVKQYSTELPPENGYILVTRNIEERIKEEEERVKMQLQLDRNQRMQSIGQLAGGIAHEFNNILTSIIGYTDLCYTLQNPINMSILHKYLYEINTSSIRSKDLVIQLLEYSQEQNIQLKPTNISDTVKKAIILLKAALPSSINIELNTPENLANVESNNVQLEQILLNLCTNAMDAMRKSGTIYIHLSQESYTRENCQSCHEEFSGDYIKIDVRNTGPQIKANELESIFQPFYTSKGRAEATGLGLSVVHGIVHSQRGHILVNSDTDSTTFIILLPIIKT
ncbi:MAG: PAS domain S-box protein [Gammaproteobacteria bacterium]|nr:PAS domain S-box protein [Gammaproteobacteria bacterium]